MTCNEHSEWLQSAGDVFTASAERETARRSATVSRVQWPVCVCVCVCVCQKSSGVWWQSAVDGYRQIVSRLTGVWTHGRREKASDGMTLISGGFFGFVQGSRRGGTAEIETAFWHSRRGRKIDLMNPSPMKSRPNTDRTYTDEKHWPKYLSQ